mmetsp:Transcript_37929/g.125679  ORF Transcript_37929/g.125679 Transcript_37929/m.125679 type:complete len:236 (-) Transcript_37929:169-876(-)
MPAHDGEQQSMCWECHPLHLSDVCSFSPRTLSLRYARVEGGGRVLCTGPPTGQLCRLAAILPPRRWHTNAPRWQPPRPVPAPSRRRAGALPRGGRRGRIRRLSAPRRLVQQRLLLLPAVCRYGPWRLVSRGHGVLRRRAALDTGAGRVRAAGGLARRPIRRPRSGGPVARPAVGALGARALRGRCSRDEHWQSAERVVVPADRRPRGERGLPPHYPKGAVFRPSRCVARTSGVTL